MFTSRFLTGVSFGVSLLAAMGCGSNGSNCGVTGLNVTPATSTANHAAAVPGNSQTFSATFQFKTNPSCPAVTAALVNSNWTASDTSVQLSSSQGTMVTATCTAAVNQINITATSADGQMLTGRASLTCN